MAFAEVLAITIRGGFTERGYVTQALVISLMGTAGVALVALQPQGATELGVGRRYGWLWSGCLCQSGFQSAS